MWFNYLITFLLVIGLINIIFNLIHIKRVVLANPLKVWPMVSVLVPTRNEQRCIKACLESLAQQDYPNYEVLVLDDSDDDTAEVAIKVARQNPVIRVIKGLPRPADWAGKNFACYQLSKLAQGEWLLFVDADTLHKPGMLKNAIAFANQNQASLLSGFPHQITTSLSQKIVVPAFYFIILCWVPFWIPFGPKGRKPGFAIGQFMLFSRPEYHRIGGHELIKGHLLDDVWLGIETGKAGGKVITADLSQMVSCHMYEDFMQMWKGFGKSIYSVIAISQLGVTTVSILGICLWIIPFINLWNERRFTSDHQLLFLLALTQVALILVSRWIIDLRLRASWQSALFHPLGILFYLLGVVHMSVCRLVGTGVRWKDCLYSSSSGVE
jgi:chlorobactene glucosyltransferase